MDYEVIANKNAGYILIMVNVPMTSEIGRKCGAEAVRLGKENNTSKFLFDLRKSPNVQDIMPNYNFAYKDMTHFGFPKDSRSALLTNPNDNSHKFIETLFRNAGYQVKIFIDELAAIAWLGKAQSQ